MTKPFTAIAAARAGLLDRELGTLLPAVASTATASATIERLLAHRAGLAAHTPLYAAKVAGHPHSFDEALRLAADTRRDGLAAAIDSPPLYSDLGYLLAGAALARHDDAIDAGEAVERRVIDPLESWAGRRLVLGTARRLRAVYPNFLERCAPTEDVPFRGGVVRGVVHDENAWALADDGGCGHAGLFGDLDAILVFAGALLASLDGHGPFERAEIERLAAERPGGTLRAGFDGKSAEQSSAGSILGPRTFGHLGFTGTSVWIDPDARIAVSLLTNRVHPTRDNRAIRAARPRAHDGLARLALEGTGASIE